MSSCRAGELNRNAQSFASELLSVSRDDPERLVACRASIGHDSHEILQLVKFRIEDVEFDDARAPKRFR